MQDQQQSSTQNNTRVQVKPEDIKRMLQTKDFYQILGVAKDSTEEEIKKSYKKLALKYHPDKLKLPGAQEVFKKIAQAYDCLTNAEKRAFYDRTGNEEPESHYNHYQQQYNNDFDPNDIFNIFFGTGGSQFYRYSSSTGARRRQNQQQQNQNTNQGSLLGGIFSMLPFFLIIFSGFFQSLFQEAAIFSLDQNSSYNIKKQSNYMGVNYFVDKNFHYKQAEDIDYLSKVEWQVEQEYINKIRTYCINNQNYKKNLVLQARMAWTKSDQNYYIQQSERVDMTHCNILEDFQKNYNIDRYF